MPRHAAEPCVFVIFGGTGDLARRKILPALYTLHNQKKTTGCLILGVTRTAEIDDAKFRMFVQYQTNKSRANKSGTARHKDRFHISFAYTHPRFRICFKSSSACFLGEFTFFSISFPPSSLALSITMSPNPIKRWSIVVETVTSWIRSSGMFRVTRETSPESISIFESVSL
jgi:hypothetical protein